MSEPPLGRAGASAMALRKELLKSIWYAFTALDVEKSGKVSKSQLKVRRTRGPGEASRHTSPDCACLLGPGVNTAIPGAPSHPEATAWGGGSVLGYWGNLVWWMLLSIVQRPQGGTCRATARSPAPSFGEGGVGITGF